MKKAYIILLLVICTLPLLLTPVLGETSSAEKRELAASPSLFEEGTFNASFSEELDDWIADHFIFRSELITANNSLKASLFGTSDEDQVIVGKSDWLYFSQTTDDYLGLNPLSESDIGRISSTLELVSEYVEAQGSRFVFAAAPNKNTLYPENMPAYYRKTDQPTNLDRLSAALTGRSYFADLRSALQSMQEQSYHARDSHWNNLGALCGYNVLMDTAGKPHETFADASWEWKKTWDGDLDSMIFPSLGYKDEQAVFDIDWTYRYTSNFHSEEDVLITTENPEAEGSLLIFRDSFSNALLPFLAQSYGTAKFSRATPYSLYELENTSYDTVIIEIVERNLHNLLLSAPVMPAPERTPLEQDVAVQNAVVRTRQLNGMQHFYGYLEDTADTGADPIYLQFSRGDSVWYAEAFPLCESALLGDEPQGRQGFSAYIPAERCDGYTVSVVMPAGDR